MGERGQSDGRSGEIGRRPSGATHLAEEEREHLGREPALVVALLGHA